MRRKLTVWLGSGDKGEGAAENYDVHREDAMVSVGYTGQLDENGVDLQVFILPDLFPAIRRVMDAIEKQQKEGR